MANILILRSVSSGDEKVKSGFADVEVQNGFAVELGEVSTDRKTRNAFKVAAPAAGAKSVGLVYNADVPVVTDDRGNAYKALTHDPRDIRFTAGTVFDIHMPSKGDEYAMTEVAGTATGAKYVVYTKDSMKPTFATADTDAILAFRITSNGKKFISVGDERIPTVEMIYE
ncbi:MAG: hypothetical protein ACLTBR_03460 [Anaerostipes sp.]|uniref:hypothetical protein n=1 Tax=Anaerostipes sp. TaxID=1872530 RepID=UPI003994C162